MGRVPVTGMLAGMNLSKAGMNLTKQEKKHCNYIRIPSLWLGIRISLVTQVLATRDKDICNVQQHLTWFEVDDGCKVLPVTSNLHSGHLPVGLCHSQRSLVSWSTPSFPLVPQLFDIQHERTRVSFIAQYHREVYCRWEGFQYLYPSSSTSRTLVQE